MEQVLEELKQEGLFFGDNRKKVDATADNDADEAETDEEMETRKKSKKEPK